MKIMTQEEKEMLLSLLKKADENGLLHVYDNNENTYIDIFTHNSSNLSLQQNILIRAMFPNKLTQKYFKQFGLFSFITVSYNSSSAYLLYL